VAVFDHSLTRLTIPPVRLAADGVLYGVLALILRIISPSDLKTVLKMVKDRKKAAA
jgi:hypothetical protein